MEQEIIEFIAQSTATLEIAGKDHIERRAIHDQCKKYNLESYSKGPSHNRILVITKQAPKQLTITDTDRKQLIEMYSLPIPIYTEPYFSYYINILDNILNTKAKYKLLEEAKAIVNKKQSEIKTTSHHLKDAIIAAIKNVPDYNNIISSINYPSKLPEKISVYSVSGLYISIDIISANYNGLKFVDKKLVLDTNNWQELISKFTDIEFYKQSKHFRQLVFGNLCLSKINNVFKHLSSTLYDKLNMPNVKKHSDDELIVVTSKDTIEGDYNKVVAAISALEMDDKYKNIWKVRIYSTEVVYSCKSAIKKIYTDVSLTKYDLEIKATSKDLYTQVYKKYMGMPLCDNDLVSMKDEYPIKYLEPFSL